MLMLLRLVPFVESNYNLIELGPRETGKTYTCRNTSNRSFVVSGGKATPATLFYNKGTRGWASLASSTSCSSTKSPTPALMMPSPASAS